jgi:hypothetical protein
VWAFYDRIAKPLLTDIRVDWGDPAVTDVVPATIPDLFAGQLVAVVGKYQRPGSGTVRISGTVAGQPVTFTHTVVLPDIEESHAAIPTVWARWRVAELENDYRMASPEQERRITDLGLQYAIATAYTSFVAVEELPPLQPGQPPRQVPVPVEMPEGVDYEGVFGEGSSALMGQGTISSLPFVSPSNTLGVGGGMGGGGGDAVETERVRPADTRPPDPTIPPIAPRASDAPWRRYLLPALAMVVVLGIVIVSLLVARGRTPQPPIATPPPPVNPQTSKPPLPPRAP